MVEFASTDTRAWIAALEAYGQRLEALGNPKLTALDTFYRVELPELLEKRQADAYITQEELTKIMQWKLSRGKWRSRLLNFVANLSDDDVRTASRKAFAALPNLKEAIAHLSTLKGVGPATASAVLAAHTPSIVPFMSDEAMVAALGGVKDYSMKVYLLFAEKLQVKSKELQQSGDAELEQFTASDVERALWSSAAETMPQKTPKSSNASRSKPNNSTAISRSAGQKRKKWS
ncbi:unnamed protein product [Sphagnum troendelagicum]|uniref:Uncharacterized protein n=1 Tax=Sphagnum troendelagicum TaxID=128251 RepID=A0ABP0T954_9BRYO